MKFSFTNIFIFAFGQEFDICVTLRALPHAAVSFSFLSCKETLNLHPCVGVIIPAQFLYESDSLIEARGKEI